MKHPEYKTRPLFDPSPMQVWAILGVIAILIYTMWPASEEEKRQAAQHAEEESVRNRLAEEALAKIAKKEEEEREARVRVTEMRRSAAEIREKALSEWDNAIRNDIEDRRTRLNKASKHHEVKVVGGFRFDNYILKDGRVIVCRTKVNDSGTFMDCDGDV